MSQGFSQAGNKKAIDKCHKNVNKIDKPRPVTIRVWAVIGAQIADDQKVLVMAVVIVRMVAHQEDT